MLKGSFISGAEAYSLSNKVYYDTIYQYKEIQKTFWAMRLQKYTKLYLGHVDFKLPVESPIRIVLQLIKNICQKLSREVEDNNVVIAAVVKDMDQDKQEESVNHIEKVKKAYAFNCEAYKYLPYIHRESKGRKREKKGESQVVKGM